MPTHGVGVLASLHLPQGGDSKAHLQLDEELLKVKGCQMQGGSSLHTSCRHTALHKRRPPSSAAKIDAATAGTKGQEICVPTAPGSIAAPTEPEDDPFLLQEP